MCTTGMELIGPIGMRDGDGTIVPLPNEASNPPSQLPSSAEALFQGTKEKIPRHVGQLVRRFFLLTVFNQPYNVTGSGIPGRLHRMHANTAD